MKELYNSAELKSAPVDIVQITHANPTKGFLSGSLVSAAAMVIGGILTITAGALFARWLGPDGFGVYSLALITLALVGGVGTLGLDNSLARFSAYYLGSRETGRVRSLFYFGIVRVLIFSSFLAFGLFLVLRFRLLGLSRLAPLATYSWLFLIAIPIYALQLTLLQSILGLQKVKARVLLEKVIQPLCRLAAPFALVLWLGNPILAALSGLIVSTLLLNGMSAFLLRNKMIQYPSNRPVQSSEKKQWVIYALPFVFYSLQNFVWAGMGLDVFLVGALLSVHAAGIYSAAFRLTPLLALARGAMDYSFGPRVGVLFGQSNLVEIGSLYRRTSTLALAWTLPAALLLAVFGNSVMRLCFGAPYEAGGSALSLLVLGFVVDSATGCNTTLLSMAGHSGLVLMNGLCGGIILFSLCWTLIPNWGIPGAAIATVSSITLTNTMATIEIWKLYRLQPFSPVALKLLAVGASVAILMIFWRDLVLPLFWPGLFGLAISAGVALLAYLGLLLVITPNFRALYLSGME